MLRASSTHVRVIYQGQQVACHPRSYDRGQLICDPGHQLEALQRRRRAGASQIEQQFDALGEQARAFHLALRRQPVRTIVHLRRLLKLVRLYGRSEVIDAIARANQYQTYKDSGKGFRKTQTWQGFRKTQTWPRQMALSA